MEISRHQFTLLMKPHRGAFGWEAISNALEWKVIKKKNLSEERFQTKLEENRSLKIVKLKSDGLGGYRNSWSELENCQSSEPHPRSGAGSVYKQACTLQGLLRVRLYPDMQGAPTVQVALGPGLHCTLVCRWALLLEGPMQVWLLFICPFINNLLIHSTHALFIPSLLQCSSSSYKVLCTVQGSVGTQIDMCCLVSICYGRQVWIHTVPMKTMGLDAIQFHGPSQSRAFGEDFTQKGRF